MFEATALKLAIADVFGGSTVVLGIIANWGTVQSLILFILGVVYFVLRIIFYIIRTTQAIRKTEMELQDQMERRKRQRNTGT